MAIDAMRERELRLKRWESQGVSRSEMSRREHISRQRVLQILGRKGEQKKRIERRMYVSDEAWRELERITRERFGLTISVGPNKGSGAVNLLLELIGSGKADVVQAK